MTYNLFVDAGHSWLEVERKELEELGIADKISKYSYQKDTKVYLEEDCDAPIFLNAIADYLRDTISGKTNFLEIYHENSPVRSYQRYQKA